MKLHTPAQINAFIQGFLDRLEGLPITAFGDERDDDGDLTDAYCAGYDPHDELGMVRPEFRLENQREIARFLLETGIDVSFPLPRNRCEFELEVKEPTTIICPHCFMPFDLNESEPE